MVVAPVVLAACKMDVDVDTEHKNTATYDVSGKPAKLSVATTAGKVTIVEKDVASVQVTRDPALGRRHRAHHHARRHRRHPRAALQGAARRTAGCPTT
ncbi:hypothetical protein ACU686_37590 [Yinghuangia aomiensis]